MKAIFWMAAALAASTVLGCAAPADFGRRPATGLQAWSVPALGGASAPVRGTPASLFPLSEEEHHLRALAAAFTVPSDAGYRPSGPKRLDRERERARLPEGVPHQDYHRRLMRTRFESSGGRFARFIGDMEQDLAAIPPFRDAALAVLAGDALRRQMLYAATEVSPASQDAAEARMEDNVRLIERVLSNLYWRGHAYAYALENLAVQSPTSPVESAGEAYFRLKEAVEALDADIAAARAGDVPAYSVVQENSLARAR